MPGPRGLLTAILAGAVLLYGTSLGWGLPGKSRSADYFPDPLEDAPLFAKAAGAWRPPESTVISLNYETGAETPLVLEPGRSSDSPQALALVRALRMGPPHHGEAHVLAALASMRPEEGNLDPHTAVYGGLYLYTVAAALKLASWTGFATLRADPAFYMERPEEMGRILVAGRLVSLLAAVAGVALMFRLGSILGGPRSGAAAAFFLAASPALWMNAHTLAPHAMGLPFFLASLLESLRALRGDVRALRRGAAWTGLSTACAVYYALGLLPLFAAAVRGRRPLQVLSVAAVAGGIFLATNPYLVAAWRRTLEEYAVWVLAEKGNPLPPGWGAENALWALAYVIPSSAGFAALPVLAVGAWRLWADRAEGLLALGLPALGGFFYLGFTVPWGTTEHQGRQMLPLLVPLLAAGSAALWATSRWFRFLAIPCMLGSLATVLVYAHLHRRGDSDRGNAQEAGRWIERHLPEGSSVGVNQPPHPFLLPRFDFRRYAVRVGRSPEEYAAHAQKPAYYVRMAREDGLDPLLRQDYDRVAAFMKPGWALCLGISPAFLDTQHDFTVWRLSRDRAIGARPRE